MREIKFRVWDKHLGVWVNNIGMKKNNVLCDGTEKRFHVMQFTGLYDKDGREIYEGDVVKCLFAEQPEDKGFFCVFKDFRWRFLNVRYPDNDYYSPDNYDYIRKVCVVVGNIHENPGLLNEQQHDSQELKIGLSDQKSNPPMGRDNIITIIVEIMTHHGPDGHTDGCDVITNFIVDLQKGNQQVWIDKYLPKKIRSNTFLFDTSCLKDQISKISEIPPYYAIGVVYDKNEFTYCLSRRIKEVVDILMLKKMSDKAKFDEEIKNLSQYFNADIFEEQTH